VSATDYALVVGIDHYPKFRPLKGARKDATEFADWLTDDQGGGLDPDHVFLVLSRDNPLEPLHDTVDEALADLLDTVGSGDPARRLYLYFSGHGIAQTSTSANLCLAKWSRLRRNLALASGKYLDLLSGSGRFTEIAFFLDCCRVRQVNSNGLQPSIGFPKPDTDAAGCRAFVAYATEFLNSAYEAETGGPEGGEEVRGHFTQALLAGLRGGAAGSGGGVTASDLKKYLLAETPRIAKESGHQQRPQIVNGFDTLSEPVFGAALPEKAVLITFKPDRVGPIILEGPRADVLGEHDVADGPWRVTLSPGMHVLTDEATGYEKVLRFRPSRGVTDVEF